MEILSNRILNMAESETLAMTAKARELKAQGKDVISLSIGEPDFNTPEVVKEAAKKAIDDNFTHYPPVPGYADLKEAICTKLRRDNGLEYKPEQIVVSTGAKQSLFQVVQCLINPGDEVIIPMPSWVSYSEMVKLAEGTVVPVQTTFENRYCLTPNELRKALTPKTRLIILCSPNNPTGAVYSHAELEALLAVLREYPDVYILADEIYNELLYTNTQNPITFSSFADFAERLVVINGVSKAYAMTGYRVGWIMSKNKGFINACIRLQGQQLTCATMVAQKAAEAALTGGKECVDQMREVFASRRKLICSLAAEIPGLKFHEPEGAFYLFPDVSKWGTGDEVAERLLEQAHVAVVSGSAFGCPSCIRLSYAISEDEIRTALARIAGLLKS